MAKHKGQVVSYAPMLGTMAVALMSSASVMLMGSGAVAGTCTETTTGSGIWTCAGAANSATDTTQTPTPATGGALTVTTTAGFGIDTSGAGGNGLSLISVAGDTNITFTDTYTASITGGLSGFFARNKGSGTTSVTTSGTVTGTTNDGVYVKNYTTATSLSVSTAAVNGSAAGIQARNYGNGTTSVTSSGIVSGGTSFGIYAYNNSTALDLTVSAVAVTGGTFGIKANNKGTGTISVTATGLVTGSGNDGIYTRNYGTDISVNAAAVSGSRFGIDARNVGSGATSVTATGNVAGGTNDGITTSTNGTNITVNAATVTGGRYGILARNFGTGTTSVTATGAVNGGAVDGVKALNSASATDIIVNTAAVLGVQSGINAQNDGTGTTSVTVSGIVTGGTGYGIKATTVAGSLTTITLNAGAAVSSTAGNGIYNNVGNSTITVNTGASVAGKIVLGAGSDNLTFAGGSFGGVTTFDGGTGTDALSFVGSSGALTGANVTNWENVVVGTGSTISFSDSALSASALTVASGGTLNAFGSNLAITGNLANNGTVTMQDGAVGDATTVSGNFVGTGTLILDVNTTLDTADTLAIAGSSTGTTLISVNNLTPGVATGNDITLVTVGGTSAATDFALSGGSLTAGVFVYTLSQSGSNFVLGSVVNSASATYEATPASLLGFTAMSSLQTRLAERVTGSVATVSRAASGTQKISQNWRGTGQTPWLRLSGDYLNAAPASSTSGVTGTTQRTWSFQAGIDTPRDAGPWVLGVNAQYGLIDASATNGPGTGASKQTGVGIGATATWSGSNGTYVDTQAKFTWISSDFASSGSGSLANGVFSTAYSFGVEAGKSFTMKNGAALTPQAQLTYGMSSGAKFTDLAGNVIDIKANSAVLGRLGLGYTLQRTSGWNINVTGNLLHNFSGTSTAVVGSTVLTSMAQKTWGEIELGGSYDLGASTRFDIRASYRTSLSGNSSGNNGVGAALSLRHVW